MTRSDLCTKESFYMIRHVYNIFKQMNDKYDGLTDREESYEFNFYNFRGTGQNIIMKPSLFQIYDDHDGHDQPIFEISKVGYEQALWTDFSLSDTEFVWFNSNYNYDLCLVVGDHEKNWDKRYIVCNSNSNIDELLEEYSEEYFFQQLTVQNIIPFEQFQKEVKWYYDLVLPNLLSSNDLIHITNIELFNLKTLEGFRVI